MHCHSIWPQTLIPSAVLAASLLGSGHCAFMCGGLVAVSAKSVKQQFSYHIGRLMSYVALGAVSGWIGSNIMTHLPEKFSEVLAILMALSFIALGVLGWNGKWHFSIPGAEKINAWTAQLFSRSIHSQNSLKISYSALIGALSIFLPCGWLYGFVLATLSTANPLYGAAFMAIFWLGTIPALIISPFVFKKLIASLQKVTPHLSPILMILAGILPLLFRYTKIL